ETLDELLLELRELGMIESISRSIQATQPFLARGRISFSPSGLAFVAVRGARPAARDVFIGPRDVNGALPGDDVLVRLRDRTRDRFEGVVVDILERARNEYRMRILSAPDRGMAVGEILDVNARLPACVDVSRISADTRNQIKPDTVVIVHMSGDTVRYRGSFMKAAFFVRFESDTDLDPDFARILMKYKLSLGYPDEIELPPDVEPNEHNVRDWKKRRDLRDLHTITIDGAESKDFDDALSIETQRRGIWVLYVHIADVAHYVKQDSALDREARARSTSYYLANRVVPMLPPSLSENLCSLVADRNRLAFTAEMHVSTKDGRILKSDFYRSIIRVDKRLTYEIAESYLDSDELRRAAGNLDKLTNVAGEPARILGMLWHLAFIQKERRVKSGRIDLEIPEPKVKMDQQNRIQAIEYRKRLRSSVLIEECMLSANTAVAAFLRKKSANALYRVHEPMDPTKLDRLNGFFSMYNVPVTLKDSSYKSLRKAMEVVHGHVGGENLERIFHLILLRSFMQAAYNPDPLGHWGLGFNDYCHFTSPIRRYPDLIVHRALAHLVAGKGKKHPYSRDQVEQLGYHTSEQERKAMDAERDTFRLKVIRYIEEKKLKKFRGFITGMKHDRVFLELEDLPSEAVVEARYLTDDRELLIPDNFSAFIKKLGRPALLGEEWELELDRVDAEEFRIYCRPLW
ncbi:MAG: VacB/RNase II family 3'-5' exoribonuclease, partial [Leptospiraceae bacterium]|nr:VacB/RNase II family 3'-5' exoribonuclease [Leptospiraceae bacterium]